MKKKDTTKLVDDLVQAYGAPTISLVLDAFKDIGFHYATQAGVTISKNDVQTPPTKGEILERYEAQLAEIEGQYEMGMITQEERHEAVTGLWDRATNEVGEALYEHLDELNPIFMMANSGARGSFSQIRQLAGMRGLMANPKGEIIPRPIKANFMEGLTVLEYFISTHGARKGLADTALRTADSGYLTRRLVDVSQDVIIREEDCGTERGVMMHIAVKNADGSLRRHDDVETSVYARSSAEDVVAGARGRGDHRGPRPVAQAGRHPGRRRGGGRLPGQQARPPARPGRPGGRRRPAARRRRGGPQAGAAGARAARHTGPPRQRRPG